MIVFKRLNGKTIALNPDLIERIEATPDTVITLVDDKKFLVAESLEEVLALIVDYRAYIVARSATLSIVEEPRPTLRVVPNDTVVSSQVSAADLIADKADDDAARAGLDADGELVEYLLKAAKERKSR